MFEIDRSVVLAIISSLGGVIGALIQLRASWHKEMQDRARGTPPTKKSRRGPILAVFALLLASAVGGFAFSQYLVNQSAREFVKESKDFRAELQARVAEISASTERLEKVSMGDRERIDSESHRAEERRRGIESVSATATVGPCRPRAAGNAEAKCSEPEALRTTLCVSVPLAAAVTEIALYQKPEESKQAWTESRATAGTVSGNTRFDEKSFDRAESDHTKQVCVGFASWESAQAASARVVAKYTTTVAPADAPSATPVLSSTPATTPASALTATSVSASAPVSTAQAVAPSSQP